MHRFQGYKRPGLSDEGAHLKLRFTRGPNTIPSSTLWVGNIESSDKNALLCAVNEVRAPSRLKMCALPCRDRRGTDSAAPLSPA